MRIARADGALLADVGDRTAVAAGAVRPRAGGGAPITIEAATLTVAQFARTVSVGDVHVAIRRDGATLASTLPSGAHAPAHATATSVRDQ